MTIAITMKVNDGIVLATDSASTMIAQDNTGQIGVVNIYNNANKLINIHGKIPVGVITWGAGSIGLQSTSSVIKDFRKDVDNGIVRVDFEHYTLEEISIKFKDFVFDKYIKEFNSWQIKPDIGFVIAGYSSNSNVPEEWLFEINNGQCNGPTKLRDKEDIGINWYGQPEAITRVLNGFGSVVPNVLVSEGIVKPEDIQRVMFKVMENSSANLISPAMPIQDAIDLAEFLVDLTEKYVRFAPGSKTVGGPIEIASITLHEGFKWIKRKHYYNKELNL